MNGETESPNTRRLLIVGALALLFVVSFGLTLIFFGGREQTPVAQRAPTTQGISTTRETSRAETASTGQGTTYSIP